MIVFLVGISPYLELEILVLVYFWLLRSPSHLAFLIINPPWVRFGYFLELHINLTALAFVFLFSCNLCWSRGTLQTVLTLL